MTGFTVLLALLVLPSCAVDEGEGDTSTEMQYGGGGGGSSEPTPPPCQGPTSPSQPIRYQALAEGVPVVFDLPVTCIRYFSIIAEGFSETEILLTGSVASVLSPNENPDLYATITDQVPGPASGGCHSENPPGQPEDCHMPDPNHPNAKFLVKIAVRATSALTGVKLVANQN
jgi:hypothetical protein